MGNLFPYTNLSRKLSMQERTWLTLNNHIVIAKHSLAYSQTLRFLYFRTAEGVWSGSFEVVAFRSATHWIYIVWDFMVWQWAEGLYIVSEEYDNLMERWHVWTILIMTLIGSAKPSQAQLYSTPYSNRYVPKWRHWNHLPPQLLPQLKRRKNRIALSRVFQAAIAALNQALCSEGDSSMIVDSGLPLIFCSVALSFACLFPAVTADDMILVTMADQSISSMWSTVRCTCRQDDGWYAFANIYIRRTTRYSMATSIMNEILNRDGFV